ncbi:MAG TPA: phenylalanine--tRNA ligase subunit alpha [Dehalococcoidia bacterium]|nr:phenylalanine--tRNA ligase subunit alpha [Dehalococcoidia bacterium]
MVIEQGGIAAVVAEAREKLAACRDEPELERWHTEFLGRKAGKLNALTRSVGTLPPDQRRAAGIAANAANRELEQAYEARAENFRRARLETSIAEGKLDVTLPGRRPQIGRLHPVTQTLRDLLAALTDLGFQVAEGPEIETDYYNFEMLRIPQDHPARDMWDTLWLDPLTEGRRPLLLRTHTSPNQIRVMEQRQPPIRIAVPGKCYRFEAVDASHEWQLTQIEGLAVDEGITLADLKGTLGELARRMFGSERQVMLRHAYFPFVEPGVEMAVDCFVCGGTGCGLCKGTGWIEILGAGMVHPEVLSGVGYDPVRYTGFAWGLGVERVAMLRYGIDDIRHFYGNDLRFLEQF